MSSAFNVQINPGEDKGSSTVTVTGEVSHVITNDEIKSFGIEDVPLKNAIDKAHGKSPNDAYLRIIRPVSKEITSWSMKPIIAATQKFVNNSGKTGDFNVSISQQSSNTVQSNWSTTKTVNVTQTINYGIQFLGSGGGGSTSLSYTQDWATGGSKSLDTTMGSSQAVTVPLKPGESVLAKLTANKVEMTATIVYEATLEGTTAVNYEPPYNGHHFYALDINWVMQNGGLGQSFQFTDTITIDYLMNSEVVLYDANGNPKASPPTTAATAPALQGMPV